MPEYPARVTVDYPASLSRGKLLLRTFFGWAYVGIPHGVCLGLYGFAASIVMFIAWWVVLFTGKYPKGMFDFVLGYYRWGVRVGAYMGFMTDVYPPFSNKE